MPIPTLTMTTPSPSPGGVTAFIGLMLFAGYLRRHRSDQDKRVVHLVPTEKFIAIVEGWNVAILRCIDAIIPEDALAQCHAAQHRFGWNMRECGAQVLLAGWKPLDPFPEAKRFIVSHGGFMLLLRVVAETIGQGEGRSIVPVAVDLSTFGKRFGVSRTHLRRLLETAHEQNLLDASPRNGSHIRASPRLIASFVSWMASELGNYRLWALATRSELGLKAVSASK